MNRFSSLTVDERFSYFWRCYKYLRAFLHLPSLTPDEIKTIQSSQKNHKNKLSRALLNYIYETIEDAHRHHNNILIACMTQSCPYCYEPDCIVSSNESRTSGCNGQVDCEIPDNVDWRDDITLDADIPICNIFYYKNGRKILQN